MIDVRKWAELPPVIEKHGEIEVLRDDLINGGSKTRFLPFLVDGSQEVVFGAPFCGGAPYALSVLGKDVGFKVTLFYAKRKKHHPRQVGALENGANIFEVPFGYMTNVQAKARKYASENGARFLPLGFDVPEAEEPFVEFMQKIRRKHGDFDEVWCAVGSGMLARCLGRGFPNSVIHGVTVGLESRHKKQDYGSNVQLRDGGYEFSQEMPKQSPFPCCGYYDRKAWFLCAEHGKGRVLFWNVMG